MVTLAETTSKPKSRRRFLRTGLRGFHTAPDAQLPSPDCLRGGVISQIYASDTTEEFGDLIGEDGQYIHQYDAQANTNALLDETGTVQAQYKYLAFGQVSAVSIDGGPWTAEDWSRRAGMPLDFTSNMLAGGKKQYYLDQEIALYLLGSGNNGRYYDAATGRFLSEDPTGEAGGDANLFRYTGNDPVNNPDPSGHGSKHQPPPPPVPSTTTFHASQTPQAQQHNQKTGGGWLSRLEHAASAAGHAIAGGADVAWNKAKSAAEYAGTGAVDLAQHPSALGVGSLQGVANVVNGVQDLAISTANTPILANNLLNLGVDKIAGLVDHGAAPIGMLPYIPSPDWSKNLLVANDPAHDVSKFLGGQAVSTLATAGGSELPSLLSGAAKETATILPEATTDVTDLAGAKTATNLSEDAIHTPTADNVTAKVPRPSGSPTEGEVARFENEGGGQPQGERPNATKPPPNPHGKLGGPAHRAEVDRVAKDIESRGLRAVKEERIESPRGTKSARYADVVAKDKQDKIVEIHQIGRQTKGGVPVARERAAIRDIEKATGTKVRFHKYQ